MTLQPVQKFKSLPPLIIRPFARFLPELLNAEPIQGKHVLDRIDFSIKVEVPSLIRGQFIAARKVFSAFITSLEEEKLGHLINIWTGNATFLVGYSKLRVIFYHSTNGIKSYRVNFCDPANPTAHKNDGLISPGEEYRAFFKKFSQNLLGPGANVEPSCIPEGVGIIRGGVNVRAKEIVLYLQSAEEMLNSLVDLLRTPLTLFYD